MTAQLAVYAMLPGENVPTTLWWGSGGQTEASNARVRELVKWYSSVPGMRETVHYGQKNWILVGRLQYYRGAITVCLHLSGVYKTTGVPSLVADWSMPKIFAFEKS